MAICYLSSVTCQPVTATTFTSFSFANRVEKRRKCGIHFLRGGEKAVPLQQR